VRAVTRLAQRPARFAIIVLVAACIGLSTTTSAHETDAYGLPIGREFADLGNELTLWAHGAIDRAVTRLNNRIDARIRSRGENADLSSLHSPDAVASAVRGELPQAVLLIEEFDHRVGSEEWRVRYAGRLTGFEPPATLEKIVLYPLNPLRAWNCATLKAYGVLLGTDKIGHFADMGYRYFGEYRNALKRGETDEAAVRCAITMGSDHPILSESGLLGYWSAGAYSNADMASNYLGMVFYRNLLEPQMLKGQLRPPMIERAPDGVHWHVASHVTPDSDFFSWFISDHYDEAINPSHYLDMWREGVRSMVARNSCNTLEHRVDELGNRRSEQYFRDKANEMRTYCGASTTAIAAPPRNSSRSTPRVCRRGRVWRMSRRAMPRVAARFTSLPSAATQQRCSRSSTRALTSTDPSIHRKCSRCARARRRCTWLR
jgi:hypothetical protein